ncbi:MAG TPA: hypothetical protein VMG41_14785 [Gemmatimonadales bacterium]|nr:hypothetical protein [Gemmatimonadales bacterium]
MSDHDEVYGRKREEELLALLRHLAERIQALDREGRLLGASPELQRLLGDARSELFHYEVRSTYDTPEIAESRRIVDEARRNSFTLDDREDDEPWRPPQAG